ncbi:hypothetical protein ScPMuIL_001559 [Solemya velum]
MSKQTFLAKATYDNIAESPDEIAFRRGDVVTVIEQDTSGLEGWWLCSLRGKTGIAPGNRLKLLSGMLESPGNNSVCRSPSSVNKVLTPRKYEQNRQDYDVPPSRNSYDNNTSDISHFQANYDTPPGSKMGPPNRDLNLSLNSDLSFYDTPPSVKSTPGMTDDTYDVPPSHRDLSLPGPYNTHSSKRSSLLSNLSILSNESNMTVSSSTSYQSLSGISNAHSFSDSARSSMDISPQDLYDVPPSQKAYKQMSSDSGLDVYDTPPKAKPSTPDIFLEDYDVPKKSEYNYPTKPTEYSYPTKPAEYSYPQHPIEHAYEEPKGSKEHDIDDLYDIPKNNAPVRSLSSTLADLPPKREPVNHSGVYDIPPQVTRDSYISSKSDSSDSIDGQRLSTCSLDSRNSDIPIYDELRLDLDAAKDLVVKLQQDVQKSTNKLCSFVSSSWRNRENLEAKMYEIKLACLSMKTTFDEFLDFALGTLANSAKLPDKKLINKLHRQLDPLQKSLGEIKGCMKNLDLMKWQTSLLISEDSLKNDNLGQLIAMAKDIPADVRKLTSVIQGNASLLFKRSHDNDTLTRDNDKIDTSFSKSTLKPKPTVGLKQQKSYEKCNDVQQRPLPAPPASDRPLPPTPTEVKTQTFFSASDPKRLSMEIKRFSGDFNYSNDLCQLKRLSLDSQPEKDINNWAQEYDYVQLEARDVDEQKRNLEEIMKDIPMKDTDTCTEPITPINIESDSESDLKTPVNKTFDISERWDCTGIHLDGNDRQVLVFYSEQIETHLILLSNAIDAFFKCIECGEGPKVFISNSKFVVISAHKLVYIGDTLHRSLINSDVRNQIILCASVLCESLKKTITATKTAALQYPSVPAVREMVDKVSSVSHASHELKLVISHASSL